MVYFASYGFGRCSRIYSVVIATSRVRAVVDGGYDPAVSPDGRFLAYNRSFSCGVRRHRLVVRNLSTGQEEEWLDGSELGFGDFAWGPDPGSLIVAHAGADSASYFLLDTGKSGPLTGPMWPSTRALDAFKIKGRPLSDPNTSLAGVTVRPDRAKVLFGIFYSSEEGWLHPIIEYDVRDETFRTVIEDAWGPVDFDPTGREILYRPVNSGLTLYRYSDGRSVKLGTGYYDAAW
jgi:hypothetical protein